MQAVSQVQGWKGAGGQMWGDFTGRREPEVLFRKPGPRESGQRASEGPGSWRASLACWGVRAWSGDRNVRGRKDRFGGLDGLQRGWHSLPPDLPWLSLGLWSQG